jgi:C-terminal processing protease CtpA/Prc
MINLDTVGRLEKKKLLILGTGSAREWEHIFRGAGFVTGVEIKTVSDDLDSSDQKSFQEAGVPAVQLFSGPHLDYHRPTDTVDKIDTDGLLKVTSVAKEALEYLAGRAEPLSSNLGGERGGEDLSKTKLRKVSLGTVPDYTFQGEGYRLSGVVNGSPADSADLREGDIIVRIDGVVIRSLRDVSNSLKSLKPGDRIKITFVREEKEMTVEADVVAR